MSKFTNHLRKDLKLLSSDSIFIILLVLMVAIASVLAFVSASSYVDSAYHWNLVTKAMIQEDQEDALENFWKSVSYIFGILFVIISSMFFSKEKESGMVRFILTLKTHGWQFYLSKFLILMVLAVYAAVATMVAYLIVFSAMDINMLPAMDIVSAMCLPLLFIMVISSIGLMVSAVAKGKGGSIALAVVLFIMIFGSYSAAVGMGEAIAEDDPDWWNAEGDVDKIDFIPLGYKLLIYANPTVLIYGHPFFVDIGQGILLGAGMLVCYLGLGMLLFARERTERGLVKDIIKRIRRTDGSSPKKM